MEQTKKGHRGLIVGFIIVLLIACVGYIAYQYISNGTVNTPLQFAKTVSEPIQAEDLAQSALITKEQGGVIRTIDAVGNVAILKVPKGAVLKDTKITLTPFETSATGFNQGVHITPEDIVFEKPVVLSFNWYLSEKKIYTKRPFVAKYNPTSKSTELTPIQRALVVRNYLPSLVTQGGWYGVSDDGELEVAAAREVLTSSEDTLALLNAGLTLAEHNKLSKSETDATRSLAEEVTNQEEPDMNQLYLSVVFSEMQNDTALTIPRAYAYGLFDGYLQFRCNLEETTYEDAMIAMDTATKLGYTDVVETCKEKATKLLIKRANLVDTQKDRPLIDAVEVLQQMQMLGLTDTHSPGAAVAQRLNDDVQASLHRLAPDMVDAPDSGTAREKRASTDPLIKHNSTLVQEMIGVQALRFIGLESFDEAGWKRLGDTVHTQMSGLNMVADELCDLDNIWPLFNEVKKQFDRTGEYDKRCKTVESGQLQQVIDRWEVDVDEYAEGVDAVQKNKKPDSSWNDYSILERMTNALEQ